MGFNLMSLIKKTMCIEKYTFGSNCLPHHIPYTAFKYVLQVHIILLTYIKICDNIGLGANLQHVACHPL